MAPGTGLPEGVVTNTSKSEILRTIFENEDTIEQKDNDEWNRVYVEKLADKLKASQKTIIKYLGALVELGVLQKSEKAYYFDICGAFRAYIFFGLIDDNHKKLLAKSRIFTKILNANEKGTKEEVSILEFLYLLGYLARNKIRGRVRRLSRIQTPSDLSGSEDKYVSLMDTICRKITGDLSLPKVFIQEPWDKENFFIDLKKMLLLPTSNLMLRIELPIIKQDTKTFEITSDLKQKAESISILLAIRAFRGRLPKYIRSEPECVQQLISQMEEALVLMSGIIIALIDLARDS